MGVCALGMEPTVGHLCRNGPKGFSIRVIGADCQLQLPLVVEGRHIHFRVHDHRHNGIVQQGRQGTFHCQTAILQYRLFDFPASGLGNVISRYQRVAFSKGGPGKNLYTLSAFTFRHAPAQGFPTLHSTKLGDIGILYHSKGNISGTVQGVVSLDLQIPGISIRVAGNFFHACVLHCGGVFPFCLLLSLPLLVVLIFPNNDFT